MILADTSIWIDHFRGRTTDLARELTAGNIVIHPFIVAELALGSLHDRGRTLTLLDQLPQARVAQIDEVRTLIETRRLYNLGIGLTDAYLIASVFLEPSTRLWTRDKPVRAAAEKLGIHACLA